MIRRTRSKRAARLGAQIAMAAPQVIAMRLTRMTLAGRNPSKRDRAEMTRMGAEKLAAMMESQAAVQAEIVRAQMQWASSAWQAMWMPWLGAATPRATRKNAQRSAERLVAVALAPYSRRAVANAKRLAGR